jgi:hypothetical protein
VFENLMIVSLPAQGAGYKSTPGDVHAYDVVSGALRWVFHSIPNEGEYGSDTWPEGARATAGGVHNWSELTVDEANGIVFIPFGSPRYDFYGGDRAGDNLFGNSLVALDARTGQRLWHQQLVHHDLWDYDLPQAPKLLTIRKDGRSLDVVAQATKHGFVYVFERKSGEPVWPIEERPVPTDLPGKDLGDAALPRPLLRPAGRLRGRPHRLPPDLRRKRSRSPHIPSRPALQPAVPGDGQERTSLPGLRRSQLAGRRIRQRPELPSLVHRRRGSGAGPRPRTSNMDPIRAGAQAPRRRPTGLPLFKPCEDGSPPST